MTSEQTLMVHAFLPGATQPVPAGKLQVQEEGIELRASRFVYGLKYLKRNGAIEIDPVGLGMLQGQQVAGQALFAPESTLFGGIRDAAPDAWGRRVIEAKKRVPANALPESVYLLEAGPNRTGALDITPDGEPARALAASTDIKSLGYLLDAAERIENGLLRSTVWPETILMRSALHFCMRAIWEGMRSGFAETAFTPETRNKIGLIVLRGGFQNNHRVSRKSGSGLRRVNDSGIFFTHLQNQVSGLTSLIECYGRHMTCQRFKICRTHGYTSMVGQAGASQDAPVPCNAGKVNLVWFRHP